MSPAKLWKIRGKSSWENLSHGRYFNEYPIWIRYCVEDIEEDIPVRLGFALSKKYGNAVKRNKFKRRTRELVRNNLNAKNSLNGLIMLVGAAKNLEQEVTFKELENAILAFISKLK